MQAITRIVTLPNGEQVKFLRLNLADLAIVCEQIVAQWEDKARKLAAEAKLDQAQINHLVLSIRTKCPSVNELNAFAISPKGAQIILNYSLLKSGYDQVNANRILETISASDLVDIASLLAVDQQDEPAKPEASDPLATSSAGGSDSPTSATPKATA